MGPEARSGQPGAHRPQGTSLRGICAFTQDIFIEGLLEGININHCPLTAHVLGAGNLDRR